MRLHRRQKYGIAAVLLMLVLVSTGLTGCGMAVRSAATSLSIDETGKLTEEIVESQGSESYTEEELRSYIEQEVELYNRSREDAIRLNTCTVQNGDVKISMEYTSCEDYAAFNQITCFAGTLQEAEDAGYEVERVWLDPDGVIGDMDIIRERFREWKVFIVSEEIDVKVPDKILYVSDNVRVTGRLTGIVETVMSENTDTEASSDSSEQAVRPQTTVHPLATVADRFAYIIYK